jgi:hypothetical protein
MFSKTSWVLLILLLLAIGFVIYLIVSNPVKGYKLVYDRQGYKLFVKDSIQKNFMDVNFTGGGRRVPYQTGLEMIRSFRGPIRSGDDSTTKSISFSFDSLFHYMGFVLTNYPRIPPQDTLKMTIYIANSETPMQRTDGRVVFQRTVLLGPTIKRKQPKLTQTNGFDYFNQGSICPVNCPDDGTDVPPPPFK